MIVVGGVMAVAFMSFQASDVRKALGAISTMLKDSPITHKDLHRDTMNIMKWACLEKKRECVSWRPAMKGFQRIDSVQQVMPIPFRRRPTAMQTAEQYQKTRLKIAASSSNWKK